MNSPSISIVAASVEGISAATSRMLAASHPFPLILLIVSGVSLVALLAVAGLRRYLRSRLFVLRPFEVALQELESVPHRAAQDRIGNSRRAVVGILHDYIVAQFHWVIPGVRRDSMLRALTLPGSPLTAAQRALLRAVLETPANEPTPDARQVVDLVDKAICFVWATAACRVRRPRRHRPVREQMPV